MITEYAELCSKSCFSFLVGASHPQEMIKTAHHLGYKSLGITDHRGFYGMVRAYIKAKELSFHFIVGCELSLQEGGSLCFLAKDLKGYQRLCRLLSESYSYSFQKSKPEVFLEKVYEWVHPEHIHTLLLPRDFIPNSKKLNELAHTLKATQLITKNFSPDLDFKLKKYLSELHPNIPRAWTWDAHFHHQKRYELFQTLQAIRENKKISEILPSINSEKHLKSIAELNRLNVSKNWIRHGLSLAESCCFSPTELRYHYPQEWLPEGKTAFFFLEELCQKGLQKRYPQGTSKEILAQLSHELKLIQELHYEDYFLTVWDIVQFARSKKILCQGRGSAANSIVCYLLEVTSIDPVQMNLLFERFISKEREEAPDIDIDFEHERREEVIQYIYQKYGRHRSGMVATLITYRTRSALRDVGKALGIPEPTLTELSKKARWHEKPLSEKETQKESDPQLRRLYRLAKQIKGFPRHLGQHTGGMIICQNRLDEISPIEPARMENRSLVQWDKYDIEKLGLLKIDILALGMLTCIRKTFDLLKKHTGKTYELHQIPQDNSKTYEMIQKSKTVGVFQIESRAQMSMLPRLKPENFYDLVVEVAIVRPGPIQGGMIHPYLRRKMGLEKINYAHPSLEPILKKTLGVPIFQEQVMKMAIEVAGYAPGEADALRRAMGAWKKTGNLEFFAADMCKRLMNRGIDEEFSKRICKQILGFGEYGFPESHAASFALLTYASSYLKANYPAFFLCALLNAQPMGFYSRHVLLSSAIREGVCVLAPCLENSFWENTIEKTNGNQWALRLGFKNIHGVQKEHMLLFEESRKKGDADLCCFNLDERAKIAIAVSENRRQDYWKALDPSKDRFKQTSAEKTISWKKPTELENIFLDFEFLEASIREHPAKLLREKYWNFVIPKSRVCLAKNLIHQKPNQNIFVFGTMDIVQSPPTARGMYFITIEDETGFLNLVLSPPIYKKFRSLIQNQWALLVFGKLQKTTSYSSILVRQIIAPKKPQNQVLQIKDGVNQTSFTTPVQPKASSLKLPKVRMFY